MSYTLILNNTCMRECTHEYSCEIFNTHRLDKGLQTTVYPFILLQLCLYFIPPAAATLLQVYLSILYLRIPETFKILLRGKVVEHHNVADDLKHQQYILYKPQAAGHEEVGKISEGRLFSSFRAS